MANVVWFVYHSLLRLVGGGIIPEILIYSRTYRAEEQNKLENLLDKY